MQEIIIAGYNTEVRIPRWERSYVGKEMAEWLYDHIGPGRPGAGVTLEVFPEHVWYSQVWFGYITYHFKRASDATLFKLKFA